MSYYPPITVKQAIEKIDYNHLLLPAIQREFVWSSTSIELLFDSLMRNYPIGSFLLWKVTGEMKKAHRYYSVLKRYREKFCTHCEEISTTNLPDFEAVLDGQQRLTALYIGLKGSYGYKTKNLAWKDNEYSIPSRKLYLCLSQDSIDEDDNEDGRVYDFRFLTTTEASHSNLDWLEVRQILEISGTYELTEFLKRNGWDSDQHKNSTISRLFDVIHVRPLINYYLEAEQDYDKALNIFIRINSGGERLSYSDLIMSTIISGWASSEKSARDEFNNLIDEIWHSAEIVIDKDFIIRCYLLTFSEDIRFRVTNFDLKNAIEFKENWVAIRAAIVETINLIRQFGYVERTITSKNALLPIVQYLFSSKRTEQFCTKVQHREDRDLIRRWFHTVLLKRIFGGQADTVLKQIRDIIREEVSKGCRIFPAHEVAAKLSKTRKSITMDDETIENLLRTTYHDRYAFPILALLYPHLDYKNNDFNMDHVFPVSHFSVSQLKNNPILSTPRGSYFINTEIFNGIVNLQMLDSNENKAKGDKTFEEWSESCKIDFDKQLLPRIVAFERFPDFVEERRNLLKTKISEAVKF